jgi:hypothetical protein
MNTTRGSTKQQRPTAVATKKRASCSGHSHNGGAKIRVQKASSPLVPEPASRAAQGVDYAARDDLLYRQLVLLRELVIRVTTAKKQETSLFHDPAMLAKVAINEAQLEQKIALQARTVDCAAS